MRKKKREPEEILPKNSLKKDLLETGLTLAVMLGLILFILNFVGHRSTVIGNSMRENFHDGDQLIVDCFTYHFKRSPKRYEVVIFIPTNAPDTHYIKRIIGLPGEKVQIRDSVIYINDEPIDDPYPRESYFLAGSAANPIYLGEDEYFVLGDNRNDSIDSRYNVGKVNIKQIDGRPILRFWPLKDFGKVNNQ